MDVIHASGMNLANVPYLLALNQRRFGVDARSWSIYQDSYIRYPEDIITPLPRDTLCISRCFVDNGMQDAKVFHVHSPYGLPAIMKRRIIKQCKEDKLLLMHYHGTYLRMHGGSKLMNKHAKYIFVSTPDLLLSIPPEHRHKAFFVPNPVSIDPYDVCGDRHLGKVRKKDPSKLRICHTTTNVDIKGTNRIANDLRFFKENYDLDFELIRMKNHWESLQAMKISDIYLDQFGLGAYGIAAIEAMMMGNVALAYLDQKFAPLYPNCPIKGCELNGLRDSIKAVLLDWDYHKKLKDFRIDWAMKFHDPMHISRYMLQIYEGMEPTRNARFFLRR